MEKSLPLIIKFTLFTSILLTLSYLLILSGISYRLSGYRPFHRPLNHQYVVALKTQFQREYGANATPANLRDFTLTHTASSLHFILKSNSQRDPNRILAGRGAHCTMYAVVQSALYNQIAREMHWNTSCRVAVGQVHLLGVNLHQFATNSFFASHDFCLIHDSNGVYAVDALTFDFIGVSRVRLRP